MGGLFRFKKCFVGISRSFPQVNDLSPDILLDRVEP